MHQRPDAWLVELEGVVLDTGPHRVRALLRSLADDGVAPPPSLAADTLGTLSIADAVRAAADGLLDETAVELATLRAARYLANESGDALSLTAGSVSFVRAAAARAPMAVVTRLGRAEAAHAIQIAGLDYAFACVVTSEDAERGKPHPDLHLAALARLARRRRVRPSFVVSLEDRAPGIRAARAAGTRVAAIGAGIPAHEAMLADLFLPSLGDDALERLEELVARPREGAQR